MIEEMIFLSYYTTYVANEEIADGFNGHSIFSDGSILSFIKENCFDHIFDNYERITVLERDNPNSKTVETIENIE